MSNEVLKVGDIIETMPLGIRYKLHSVPEEYIGGCYIAKAQRQLKDGAWDAVREWEFWNAFKKVEG